MTISYVPVSEISVHCGIRGPFIFMRAYLDSSGQSKDPRAKHVTLAAYVATASRCATLESAWSTVLEKHDAPLYTNPDNGRTARYFHFNEAIHQRQGFSGWSESRVAALIGELVDVFGGRTDKESMVVTCTVDIAGYKKAVLQKPALPVHTEQICADICFSFAFRHAHETDGPVSELFIDRGDWFTNRVLGMYNRKRSKRPWWAQPLVSAASVDSHFVQPVQAIDLIAGIVNRHHTRGKNDKWGAFLGFAFLAAPLHHVVYEGHELLEMTDENGEYIKGKSAIRTKAIQMPGPE